MMPMRTFRLWLLLLCSAAAVPAQLPFPVDLVSGFSYARIPAESGGLTPAGLNGWHAAVKLNLRPRIGWVFEAAGGYGERRMMPFEFQPRETLPGAVRQHTVLLGPEFKAFAGERWSVHARALIGAAYISNLRLPLKEPFVPAPGDAPITEFNIGKAKPVTGALGGSLDYRLSERISLRLLQAEMVVVSLGALNRRRLRLSTGVVFTFGG